MHDRESFWREDKIAALAHIYPRSYFFWDFDVSVFSILFNIVEGLEEVIGIILSKFIFKF